MAGQRVWYIKLMHPHSYRQFTVSTLTWPTCVWAVRESGSSGGGARPSCDHHTDSTKKEPTLRFESTPPHNSPHQSFGLVSLVTPLVLMCACSILSNLNNLNSIYLLELLLFEKLFQFVGPQPIQNVGQEHMDPDKEKSKKLRAAKKENLNTSPEEM